jgi:predicted ester cyclase
MAWSHGAIGGEEAQHNGGKHHATNPMVMQSSTNLALALELTAEGTTWRVSNPLAELFGQLKGQRHLLFGLPLLDPAHVSPPMIEPASLPAFTRAFQALLRELLEDGTTRKADEEISSRTQQLLERYSDDLSELEESDIVQVRVPGKEMPLYLQFRLGKTADITEHSVALVPKREAHAAITVTFTDVTEAEAAKALVQRRYQISYNDKLGDDEVASLFADRFCFNAAGTQAPLRVGAASRSGVANYLDRRSLFVRAFPDIHFEILEINAIGERVVTSWCWTATHTGPYTWHSGVQDGRRDLPPTGQRVVVHGIAVDICRDGKIVDHAAYYDHAAIVRQLQPPSDGSSEKPSTDDAAATAAADDAADQADADKLSQRVSKEAVEEQLSQLYASKMLGLLDHAMHGVGLAVCVAGETLPVAACSTGFAAVFTMADKQQALGESVLSQLQRIADFGEHPEAEQTLAVLAQAARTGQGAQGVLVVRRGAVCEGLPSLLFVAMEPLRHEERDLFSVLVLDNSADPAQSLHSTNVTPWPRRSLGAAPAPATTFTPAARRRNSRTRQGESNFAWQPELICEPPPSPTGSHAGTPARLRFAEDGLVAVLTAALHCFSSVGFCLADQHAQDLPIVWVSRGFERLSGYSRHELVGHNCRKLQCEATDPEAVACLSDAIHLGQGVRTTLWNMSGAQKKGFWNCISLFPCRESGSVRYFASVQLRLEWEKRKQIVHLERTLPKAPTRAQSADTTLRECVSPMKATGSSPPPFGAAEGELSPTKTNVCMIL